MVTAHVYTSEPWRSDTILGRTGPTMVWSSADRNMPSRTAPRISSFARTLSPSAGSSATDGVWSPSAAVGNDSMGQLPSCSGSVGRVGEVVVMDGSVVDLGREG